MRAIPWRLVGWVLAAVLILAGANHALGFIPFTPQWSAKRAAVQVEALTGEVSTLNREAAGNAEVARATDTFHTETVIIREATATAIAEARSAPDADTPLNDERADRLRDADLRLCDQFPGLCADPDPAVRRPDAVRPAGPAGAPDARRP